MNVLDECVKLPENERRDEEVVDDLSNGMTAADMCRVCSSGDRVAGFLRVWNLGEHELRRRLPPETNNNEQCAQLCCRLSRSPLEVGVETRGLVGSNVQAVPFGDDSLS